MVECEGKAPILIRLFDRAGDERLALSCPSSCRATRSDA